jgi:hypothetical protein
MKLKTTFKVWLPFAVVISAFSMLVYASVQQAYRQGANDPQIQMANDAADALNSGSSIESIMPQEKVFFEKSLASFYLIFNSAEQPIAGSGILNNSLQTLPDGVLAYAKEQGENRVTWQPQPGVRVAAVIVPYKDGFVLAGRNLREVEVREAQVQMFAGVTWLLALIATFIVIAFGEYVLGEKR